MNHPKHIDNSQGSSKPSNQRSPDYGQGSSPSKTNNQRSFDYGLGSEPLKMKNTRYASPCIQPLLSYLSRRFQCWRSGDLNEHA